MPLNQPVRYRVHTTESGKKIRLAFAKGGNVIEAKSLDSGKVHTPSEFKADRKGAKLKKAMLGRSSHTSNAMR